ncbi:MAG: choice-of-anchor J domain-containing protein [Muribaculaceae bacterium]|nr:choice-of-anchor J domain-containing protein [Muribaculaceae bacterium]
MKKTFRPLLSVVSAVGVTGTALALLGGTPPSQQPKIVGQSQQQDEAIYEKYPVLRTVRQEQLPSQGMHTTFNGLIGQAFKAPVSKVAAPKEFFGNIVYQNNWDSRYNAYGFYNILVGEEVTLNQLYKGTSSTTYSNGGCVKMNNLVYSANWGVSFGDVEVDVRVYDLETGKRVSYLELEGAEYVATDYANDEKNDIIYGVFWNEYGNGYELATVTFSAQNKYLPNKKIIGEVDRHILALGVTSDGLLYGIGDDGCLYNFDTETAAANKIGDTGVKVSSANGVYPQSGTIDQHNNIFYWACVNGDGESILYTVDLNDAHVEEVKRFPLNERIYGLQALPHAANDMAPNALQDFNVAFSGNALTGEVSFTVADDTFNGSSLSGNVDWTVLANGEEVATGTASAGGEVKAQISVSAGQNVIEAYASNAAGKSPMSTLELWVGDDTPAIKEAKFEYINDTATVTWIPEENGIHGGYVSNLKYDVYRMPMEEKVASNVSSTSFSETLTSEMPLANYYYDIVPVNATLEGERFATNKIQIGQAIIPPYKETFDTEESLDLYLLGDAWSWGTRGSSTDGVAMWNSDVNNPNSTAPVSKEWLITPEIKLDANCTYEISFATYGPFGDKFEVLYGEGADPSKYKLLLGETAAGRSSDMSESQVITLESEKDQKVRIAFRHVGREEMFIRLDNLVISAPRHAAVPSQIEDLTAIAAPMGELKATLSFTTPTTTIDGNPIDELVSVTIYEGMDEVATIDHPGVGEKINYEYAAKRNGYHNFNVEVANSKGMSRQVSANVFIGVDKPLPPVAYLRDKGNYIELEWTPNEAGVNGEYVNIDDLTYNLYQEGAGGRVQIAKNLKGTSCKIELDPSTGPQGVLQLLISAVNVIDESPLRYTSSLVVGEPNALPFHEHFNGESGLYWIKETNQQTLDYSTSHFSDDDGYSLAYGVVSNGDGDAMISSGKISLDAKNPVVALDYIVYNGNVIEIYQLRPDGSDELIGTCSGESSDMTDWLRASFPLKHSDTDTYCRLRIKFVNNSGPINFMCVDNLSVMDQRDRDIKVESSINKSVTTYGTPVTINATATNVGQKDCDGFDLELYINDILKESRHIDGLKAKESFKQMWTYSPTPGEAGDLNFMVYANYADDEYPDNNEVIHTVQVLESHVSAPENLSGTQIEENAVRLEWEAPSEYMVYKTTEDFESYEPCTTTNLGEWKTIDVDGRRTIGLGEANFPNNGAPMAFMVFNPESIGVPAGNTEANPHSGKQYLVSFATILDNPDDHNDDWLISPALSGNAQTISFYAKQMITNFGPEDLEILYSNTGREIADFTLLKEIKVSGAASWEKFEADLPEGSLYFAIRVVTAKGHMLLLDDVTFEKGSSKEIKNYNVYRNNAKIGSVNGNVLTFTDPEAESKSIYHVSAVYVTGEESSFSNPFELELSGITAIIPNMEYNVVGVEGILFKRYGRDLKNLPPGIYIVNGRKMVIK